MDLSTGEVGHYEEPADRSLLFLYSHNQGKSLSLPSTVGLLLYHLDPPPFWLWGAAFCDAIGASISQTSVMADALSMSDVLDSPISGPRDPTALRCRCESNVRNRLRASDWVSEI